MEVQFELYVSTEKFINLVEPFLLYKEAEHNIILSLLLKIKKGAIPAETCLMSTVVKNEQVLLAFLQIPSNNLIIGTTDFTNEAAIQFAVTKMYELGMWFPSVIASKPTIGIFVSKWQSIYNRMPRLAMDQGIYELKKTKQLMLSSGLMRLAKGSEVYLIGHWMDEFSRVTPKNPTLEQCLERAMSTINEEKIYVWEVCGEPVSMVMKNRETRNGVVVSWVYTPKEKRGNGYATSLVHQFSEMLLREYKFCFLYTDLNFPTSNKIYKKIGYKLVCESAMYYL